MFSHISLDWPWKSSQVVLCPYDILIPPVLLTLIYQAWAIIELFCSSVDIPY